MNKFKTLDEFLDELDEDRRLQVLKLRELILHTDPSLIERIKWNAPSYVKDGQDRITFNTINKEQVVKLVFHMGATRKEDKKGQPILNTMPLMEWLSDIRGYMTFRNLEETMSNEEEIVRTIRKWLTLA